MTFLKEHLVRHHYNWSTETTHSITNPFGRRVADRSNGNQILHLINFLRHSVSNLTVNDGQIIKSLIIKELPAQLKSELALFNGLKENIYIIGIKNKTVTF